MKSLPLLPLRDVVVFPGLIVPILVGRKSSIEAVEHAMVKDKAIFLTTQKRPAESPKPKDLYAVGVISEVLQILKLSDGSLKILIEGRSRAKVTHFSNNKSKFFMVKVEDILPLKKKGLEIEALIRTARDKFERYVHLNPRLPEEMASVIKGIDEPQRLVDTIASHIILKMDLKQGILEEVDSKQRLEALIKILSREIEILEIENKILGQVKDQVEKTQKNYFLHEQMKAIQKELGTVDEHTRQINELRGKIEACHMSKEGKEKATRELNRLSSMMPTSPEATVVRTYLDWMVSIPWDKKTEDRLNISSAQKILDEDHYGLKKVKERILEFLAVRKLVTKMKGPILCFVGPPGVGKTSLARSVARALGRNFTRLSLGGVRDEAEIRGHRRTYIGALPGRIIQSLRKAQTKNPVFLLDEVDKMSVDFRGDPSAALLEVLDPEQNHTFSDHYLEVDFDLSDVLFITTANTAPSIPPALRDRMETISLPGYTEEEKVNIAIKFLVPKGLKNHGLNKKDVHFSKHTIRHIIRHYTREAGVRNLEREIAAILRKIARKTVEKKARKVDITVKSLNNFLGPVKYRHTKSEKKSDVGVATGLAWTEVGGDIMPVEVAIVKGRGRLTLTGQMGSVMQESAHAALTYIRSQVDTLGLEPNFYRKFDIHVHVPEGAIPKDGPSAGITIAVALVSALIKRPVHRNIGMSGEVTLRGKVLPIGGIKSKILAAHSGGLKTVILSKENKKDLVDIPKNVLKELKLYFVDEMKEVIEIAIGRRTL